MWTPVSEERGQCGATCRKRGGGGGGGHCEVAADSAQQTLTANQSPRSTFGGQRLRRKRAGSVGLVGRCGEAPPPSGDELFWHKCLELQRYIHPLASILQGLRSGRFSRRLSSLQQGVAVERIQRIMAVLQNPNMGGRFLTTIQKIEGMLESWFPHVSPTSSWTDDGVVAKRRKRYSNSSSSSSSPPQEVMQVNAVSSSTDCLGKRGRILAPPLHPGLQGPLPFNITSPCLERLLQAKESIVTPYAAGGCSRRL
ncbi:circadian-associated transcriptional repressor-like [Nelusetta ayraudi]|uniref:circadian-associated transcriptional repressor-like n=1 Tax=Nelusetta ayraudi TaxID=303726 RepID=UPI003F72BB3E